jgi:hypothetical protein
VCSQSAAPQAKHPHPLGERALNARPLRIELAAFSAREIGLHAINGFLLWLRLELEAALLSFCTGTASPLMTACAVLFGKCDSDVVMHTPWRRHLTTLAAFAIAMLVTLGAAQAQNPIEQSHPAACSTASLKGSFGVTAWGFTVAGSPVPPALQGPFASGGGSTFDGEGNLTLTASRPCR